MIALAPAFIAGFALCLLLLIIFHLLFDSATEEVRYGLGAGAICAGCALAGFILNDPVLAFGPAIITSSGLVIVVWQYAERRIKTHKERSQRSSEIVGMARGILTQDTIDQGGKDAQRSRHDRAN